MPYEPTNWKSGDVVTSAKLNKIEAGIASGGVLVATDTEGTLDKTWQEIHDAAFAVVKKEDSIGDLIGIVLLTDISEGAYILTVLTIRQGGELVQNDYVAESANGYPLLD